MTNAEHTEFVHLMDVVYDLPHVTRRRVQEYLQAQNQAGNEIGEAQLRILRGIVETG